MAKKYQSTAQAPRLSKSEKEAARARAESHFSPPGGKKKAAEEKANGKPAQRVLQDLTIENGPKARDFDHHYKTAKGLKGKVDEAQGRYRAALKAAKECGIDTGVITATMKWEKADPLGVAQYFKQLRATFQAAGIEVQLDIFNESTISRPAQIFDDGFKAAKAGKAEKTNPHDAGSQAGQTWLAGYHAGSLDNAALIGKTAKVDSLGAVSH